MSRTFWVAAFFVALHSHYPTTPTRQINYPTSITAIALPRDISSAYGRSNLKSVDSPWFNHKHLDRRSPQVIRYLRMRLTLETDKVAPTFLMLRSNLYVFLFSFPHFSTRHFLYISLGLTIAYPFYLNSQLISCLVGIKTYISLFFYFLTFLIYLFFSISWSQYNLLTLYLNSHADLHLTLFLSSPHFSALPLFLYLLVSV